MTEIMNRYSFLLLVLLIVHADIFAQERDSINAVRNFGGSVIINTKGISTIPNLTLGKPAAIFVMTAGRRISFDPELRFALEGKPWSFIFWWHYQILNAKKFQIRTGVNTSVYFKSTTINTNSVSNNILVAKRSLTEDLSASYLLAKYFAIGTYYMYIRNFDPEMPVNTHFLALRAGFSDISISKKFYMRFNPQFYYLKMDKVDGFYFNASLTLLKRDFPVTISALINKAIKTKISAGEDFLWNAGIIYSFNKKYIERN